jgi:hypothetical protein
MSKDASAASKVTIMGKEASTASKVTIMGKEAPAAKPAVAGMRVNGKYQGLL